MKFADNTKYEMLTTDEIMTLFATLLTDAITVSHKDSVEYGYKKGYRKALEDCIELLNKKTED